MWQPYRVPFWRQVIEWWHGRPGEPMVMRRRTGRTWEVRPLSAAEHAWRREAGLW